ncbi:hypothetical protein D187_003649 [Cystobacter fuscus DSM 2262]|uniref:Uncharacterized protein n=1 Tax=Cystobacter fuscus (strain ATCC 25194 / DSM 2262 / NBRC 100088 / M29) TaxID=1242864 RepID=S9QC67_CYSF2|nr:hypothetical protein D187_003649 [Cystobacter fuscus DSM 2262]
MAVAKYLDHVPLERHVRQEPDALARLGAVRAGRRGVPDTGRPGDDRAPR